MWGDWGIQASVRACLLNSGSLCDIAAVQETHFTCGADCRVLESDFNVFSAYGSGTSAGVSLLVGRSLDANVDAVFAGDGGRLGVVDVAVKSFKFRLVAVYASNIAAEGGFLFSSVCAVPGRYEAVIVMRFLIPR